MRLRCSPGLTFSPLDIRGVSRAFVSRWDVIAYNILDFGHSEPPNGAYWDLHVLSDDCTSSGARGHHGTTAIYPRLPANLILTGGVATRSS
ncbi:hypothetical protein OBBRIDRAFT_850379 [Obba rivulosa]|uniref:Uncharacterized protein n=1 Tax=Obba rivulosa TaxID=1052685 RepID=A0A8E2DR89_9APHY|nr:hypothetical protein OBBRIDRAFT_850379 [Obba rivulosa]